MTPHAQEVARKLADSLNALKAVTDQPGYSAESSFRLAVIFEAMQNLESAGYYAKRARDADPRNIKYQKYLDRLLARK